MGLEFWQGKNVLITGHTGFKGSWLSLWLQKLGAHVAGYALKPERPQDLFYLLKLEELISHNTGEIRDLQKLREVCERKDPDVIFHMAAQPLVRYSYEHPVDTYETNVMGTVNLLEAVRRLPGHKKRAVVVITSDKCYENREWVWGYRETDRLGGFDPYSSSKACAELITASYRRSFYSQRLALASARAGNVIGGGDWAKDRLIPDCCRALLEKRPLDIRHPGAVRPWQHVLEPLAGYMMLAERMYEGEGNVDAAWNFGPYERDVCTVREVVQRLIELWGEKAVIRFQTEDFRRETRFLKLDASKAIAELGWRPRWSLEEALRKVVEWLRAYGEEKEMRPICEKQIEEYMAGGNRKR